MKGNAIISIMLGLAGLTAPQVAAAGILYSGIGLVGADLAGSQQIYNDALYASFSNGAAAASLADVKLQLSGGDATLLTVRLYADASLAPGSEIAVLGQATESGLASAIVDFKLSSPIALAAGTRYWIGLSASDASLSWDYTQDVSGPGVVSEYVASLDAGSGGLQIYDATDGWPFEMQVSTVPEPGSAILMAAAFLGIVGIRRRPAF